MPRLSINDINDELVKPVVSVADLSAADAYLDDLARSLDGNYTLDDIPDPLPYRVKRLVVAWVCREVCARKAGGSAGSAFKNQETVDKWTAKLPYFVAEVQKYESQITPELLTGQKTTAAVGTIEIGRA